MSLQRSYCREHGVMEERNVMTTPWGDVYPDQDLCNFSAVHGHETERFRKYVALRLEGMSHEAAWHETTGWRPDQASRDFGLRHGVMRLWDYLAARDSGADHDEAAAFALREKPPLSGEPERGGS